MHFRPWRSKRAKGGRRFSRTHQSRRPFQSGRFIIEPLESRRLLAANLGILLLDHTGMPALYSAGSGGVHVTGSGSLVIDSHDPAAAVDIGPGNITAGEIHVTGGLMDLGAGQFQGTVSHPTALDDPLASLTAPPITTPVHGAVFVKGNTSITLSPGTYNGGIHISGNAQVTLQPGIYNLQGGGLSVVDNASLTGTGVTIYNGAKKLSDNILIGGNATVTLSAPTSGTYKNVVIFQNRNSKAPVTITGGNIHITGAVYAPNAPLFFDTNHSMFIQGSADQGINGQLVVFKIVRLGAGSINVDATNNQVADLAITLTDDTTQPTNDVVEEATPNVAVTTAVPGQSVTYTITVTNNGPRPVTGAVVKDLFPSAITSDNFTAVGTGGAAGFTASGTGNINDTVDLPVNATITYTVVAQIASSATGSLVNTATVTAPADPPDPNLANNTATDTDTLTPIADLAITKTDNSDTAVPGSQVTYTITVTNNGPSDVTGATVSDTIPSAFASYTVSGTNGFNSSGSGGSAFSDTHANLASGASITYTITGTLSQTVTGNLTNTATVAAPSGTTDPTSGNNSATDSDTLVPLVDLAVTKTDSSETAVPGQTVTYTITVTNNGPSAVSSIVLNDTLPSALSGVSFSPSAGSYDSGTGVWSGLNLTPGASVTMQVSGTIDPAATGDLTNSVLVLPPEGVNESNGDNNSATDTDTLTPEVDLAVAKTDNQTSAVPGDSVTYTVTVTNSGPSTVSSLALTDTIPAALGSVTFTPSTGSYNSGTGVWSGLTLASGQSITMQVSGTIDPAATGNLVNSVTVAPPAGATDTNSGNNTASDTDTLTPQVDLAVTKTDSSTTAVPGTNITYTIVVSNSGPSTATGVVVNDILPNSIAFVSSTSTQGSYDSTTGVATIGTIAPGASVTLTITGTVSATATGTVSNTATASSNETDTNSGNNSATDTDTLTPQADLSVTKDDGTTFVFNGSQVTYTISVTNNGPSTVTSVTLTDTVPAELLSPAFTPASGSYDSGTGVWSGLSLASGQSVTMQLVGTLSGQATGSLVNTATVAPPNGVTDPNLGNNSATDTDTISEPIG